MIIDSPILANGVNLLFKFGFILFAIAYFIFSLIIIRQVFSLTNLVRTDTGFLIRALALLHSLVALGIIALFIYLL